MKKRALISAILCSVALVAGNVTPAMADAVKVVTLGADLSQADKDKMLRYFKVDTNQVQILSITNADEREHLSKYFSDSVIGTRTVSCAYVKPTTSGGIKVRTANLNKVTCNMIASILSTSGVSNCEVVAACPFEVSGTGALTGIMMAYETASGEKLDETKKEIATEELAVTADLVEEVGQDDATTVINQSKMEVVGNDIHNGDEIYSTVVNISQQNGIILTEDQLDTIVSLLEEIAEQNYDYDEMRETLENVDENITGETGYSDEEELVPAEDPDSIVADLDESILGENVIAGSTEDPAVAEQSAIPADDEEAWDATFDTNVEETPAETYEEPAVTDETEGFGDEAFEEVYEGENSEEETYEGATYDEQNQSGDDWDETDEDDELNIDSLDPTQIGLFNHAESFAQGEYEGNDEALRTELGEDAIVTVLLDSETGEKLSKEVLKIYLDILENGTDLYVPADTDIYMTTELNMIDQQLRRLFTIEGAVPFDGENILASVSQEDRDTLYKDTMHFFEKLYNETTDEFFSEEITEEVSEEAPEEEPYTEETYAEEEETYE